ncbi:MAG TPA: ester cyclase [Steroidobacter sp.]|jgi:steroid delta-isomerase-like uncharacterized protein|nr:ester cyclase [Steroidobacter sp.]
MGGGNVDLMELRRKREALVHRHMTVEESGDAAAVVATFSRPRYDLVAQGVILEGAEAVSKRVQDMCESMPGARIELVSLRHTDDAVIVETRTRGRHEGPLFGLRPTGRPYDVRGIAIFVFEGEALVSEVVYYDRLTLIDQIRGRPFSAEFLEGETQPA